ELHVRPVRLLHGQPVAVRREPPLGHPLRLFLDRGKRANGVLVETGRQAVAFDVGNEAGVVTTRQRCLNFGLGCHVLFPHTARAPRAPARRCSMSARLTPRSALSTVAPMPCQSRDTAQNDWRAQPAWPRLHSVRPIGPSSASTISASEMSLAERARR